MNFFINRYQSREFIGLPQFSPDRCSHVASGSDRGSDGFALVISLTLMSFVLMLLLSLSLLVQVELRSAQASLQQLLAKENARLGLMLAIGDLQRYAGPDNRVTARAEVMTVAARAELMGGQIAEKSPYWTGVWDTANPTNPPRWMTSWQNQEAPVDGKYIELVGDGSVANDPDQHVSAPAVQITGKNGDTLGEIAWWVSDEGVKASLGTVPLHAREAPSFYGEDQTDALQLQLAAVHGLEEIISDYDRFTFDKAKSLGKISSVSQGLEFLGSSAMANINGEAAYHVFTPASYGVLANVLPASESGSGSMQDLSLFPRLLGEGLEEYLGYGEEHADEGGLRLFTNIQGSDAYQNLKEGDIATPIFPILSNIMMAFTIRSHSPVSSNPNFYLRMRFFCEFWNPYTHSLLMQNTDGDRYELELEITGLPEVVVKKTTGSRASSPPIDIQKLVGDPSKAPDSPLVIRLTHDYSLDWLPGQAKNWTGVDANRALGQSPYWSIQNSRKYWTSNDHTVGGEVGLDTGVARLSANLRHESSGSDELTVRVYLSNVENPSERRLIETIEGLAYGPVSTRPSGYGNTHRGTTFGYHFILRGPHHSMDDPDYPRGLWLRHADPRNPVHKLNPSWYANYDKEAGEGSAFVPVKDGIIPLSKSIPLPSEISEQEDTIDTDKFQRILDRSAASGHYNRLWQDTPLFELPRERVLTLASLQHLYFHNERPFQVGNSWGSEGASNTSEWFDRYYFTGISRSDKGANIDLDLVAPNPTLINYRRGGLGDEIQEWQDSSADDSAAAREPAALFMVSNRFNLNSTSKAAWKAVLSSLRIEDYNYLDFLDADTSDPSTLSISSASKERMFARFSHSLQETYEATQTPEYVEGEPVAPSAFYRHGARRLTERQVDDLADNIVSKITERAEPFLSMEEFLSASDGSEDSLLESAIADALAPNGKQEWIHDWEIEEVEETSINDSPIDIDHFSPGFLTQADVMTAIGPMLAPRSDTFKIRARSNSYNVLGEPVAIAAIEALVQRTPELVDPTEYNLGPMDRKFKLLNLRWLSKDEI